MLLYYDINIIIIILLNLFVASKESFSCTLISCVIILQMIKLLCSWSHLILVVRTRDWKKYSQKKHKYGAIRNKTIIK